MTTSHNGGVSSGVSVTVCSLWLPLELPMLAPESIPEGISPFFNKPTGRGTVTENAAGPPDGARGDDVGLLYRRPPVLLVLAPREEGREDDRDEGLEEACRIGRWGACAPQQRLD